jgi:hypothetical protein
MHSHPGPERCSHLGEVRLWPRHCTDHRDPPASCLQVRHLPACPVQLSQCPTSSLRQARELDRDRTAMLKQLGVGQVFGRHEEAMQVPLLRG